MPADALGDFLRLYLAVDGDTAVAFLLCVVVLAIVTNRAELRVSELVSLRVRDIDGERKLLRIEQGKGAKDRQVIIAPALLDRLRRYWQDSAPPTGSSLITNIESSR